MARATKKADKAAAELAEPAVAVIDDEHERPNCVACDTPLQGMFCHECGQHHGGERGLDYLAKDALAEALSLEGKTVATLRDMFWRPGRLLNAYRLGVGDRYFTPFKLFLLVSAAFFIFVSWVHVPIYQYLPYRTGEPVSVSFIDRGVEIRGVVYQDIFLRPAENRPVVPELERAFDRALPSATPEQARAIQLYRGYNAAFQDMNDFWNDWLPRLIWLLSPVYVLLLIPFFPKRPVAEHALFAIWAHCVVFVILMAVALVNLTGVGLPARVLFPAYLGVFTLAAASYYGLVWWQALLRGLGHMLVYALLVWFPVLLGFAWSYAGERTPLWAYFAAYAQDEPGLERVVIPAADPPAPVSPEPGKR